MKKPNSRTEVGATIFGYRDGLRQYSRAVRLQVSRPREFFSDDAKLYLSEKLEVENSDTLSVEKIKSVELDPLTDTYVGFVGLVARHALQSGSYPAFERVLVLSAQPAPLGQSKTAVVLLAPAASYLSYRILQNAFDLASLIGMEFTLPPYKRKQLAELTDNTMNRFVERTRSHAKGGYSMRFLFAEAFNRGIPVTHTGFGHYQFGHGRNSKIFLMSATQNDSIIGARLTFDKAQCVERMKIAGFPVPISRKVEDAKQAQAVAAQIGYPVVIKPSDRDRGEGVTVDVQTSPEVFKAFKRATQTSNSILVENRVPGICHRLLVFKDQLVFAYARHPLSVVGDGTSSIRELVGEMQRREARKAMHLRKKTCTLDELALNQLKRQNCTPETVLEPERIAHVRPYEGEVWGGYDEYLTERVHPDNANLARRAARLFGLEVAGIDIISEDISRPWHETGAVINEVNYRPQVAENTARAFMELSFPEGQSQVHVECFIGDDTAMGAAKESHLKMAQQSDGAFLTSHNFSLDSEGNPVHLSSANGVFRRSEILLQDNRLQSLIVVVQTDELLATGLPFPTIQKIHKVNSNIQDFKDVTKPPEPNASHRLTAALEAYLSESSQPQHSAVS